MCTAWAWSMVADLRGKHQHKEADELKKYFGFKREVAYRGEQVFYWAMAKMLPVLNDRNMFRISLDKPASSINGGPKNVDERRPDYFHVFGEGPEAFALLGEFDEDIDHEDCAERLREIAHLAKVPIERVFVYRIHARRGTNDALFSMHQSRHVRFAEITEKGEEVVKKVVEYLKRWIEDILKGISPDIEPGKFSCMYFHYEGGEVRMQHMVREKCDETHCRLCTRGVVQGMSSPTTFQ